jgi:hypothetical protein
LIEAGDFIVGARDSFNEPAVDPKIDEVLLRVPSSLVRTLYVSGYNVIDGVRRKLELTDAVKHLTWNGVRSVVIWIERPGTPVVADNTEVTSADATDIVLNDGTLEDLRAQLKLVLERHFGPQDEKPAPIPVFDSEGEPVDLSAQVAEAL